MNEELAVEALDAVAGLIKRAVEITHKAPYWVCVIDDDETFAQLQIRGKRATLRWPAVETEWDYSTLETEQVSFPTRLLFISDDELAAWKLEQERKYEREKAGRTSKRQQVKEAEERAEFERLKAQYG